MKTKTNKYTKSARFRFTSGEKKINSEHFTKGTKCIDKVIIILWVHLIEIGSHLKLNWRASNWCTCTFLIARRQKINLIGNQFHANERAIFLFEYSHQFYQIIHQLNFINSSDKIVLCRTFFHRSLNDSSVLYVECTKYE